MQPKPLCPHRGAASSSDTLCALTEAIALAPRNRGAREDPGQYSQRAAPSKHSLLCPGMRLRGARARNRRRWLTCRCARLQDSGEQRRGEDGEQPPRALALRGPPERNGGREGEEEARRRGRGTGMRGADPTWVPWCSRRTPARLLLRNKGGARRRPQDPGCRPRLSHPRTETRLRRALSSPTRGAPPRRRSQPSLPTPPSSRHSRALCNPQRKPGVLTQRPTTPGGWDRWGFLT